MEFQRLNVKAGVDGRDLPDRLPKAVEFGVLDRHGGEILGDFADESRVIEHRGHQYRLSVTGLTLGALA